MLNSSAAFIHVRIDIDYIGITLELEFNTINFIYVALSSV